jgi:hypothetical protein
MEYVLLALCVHVSLARQKDEEGQGLENVETRKRADVILEFKPEDFREMRIHHAVLDTP